MGFSQMQNILEKTPNVNVLPTLLSGKGAADDQRLMLMCGVVHATHRKGNLRDSDSDPSIFLDVHCKQ